VKKLIDIAKECMERNNLFSMFAFLAGLNLTPVQRLKKTWAVSTPPPRCTMILVQFSNYILIVAVGRPIDLEKDTRGPGEAL